MHTKVQGSGRNESRSIMRTTLDPKTRTMMQVKIEQAEKADEVFSTLMGDVVEPRKDIYSKTLLTQLILMLKKLGVTMQEKDNKRFEDNKQYMSVQNSLKNKIKLFHNDLPDDIKIKGSIAVDTETMGLIFQRDRLCLIQMADSDGNCYLVKISKPYKDCPNIKKLMER